MDVQINTANNVEGHQALSQHLKEAVRERLSRFEERLTRIEVHVSDESGDRDTGQVIRCVMEARPAGLDPVTVSEQADSIEQATSGALGKMVSVLDRAYGKLSDRKGH